MRKTIILAVLCLLSGVAPAFAVNTWAGNTAEDMAEEKRACAADSAKFCGESILIFEMENCLKEHLRQLSKDCRNQLTPTDFRKYYRQDPHPLDFLHELFR